MMIVTVTVFVVGRTQIVSVDVAETQDPFEDAAESELKTTGKKTKAINLAVFASLSSESLQTVKTRICGDSVTAPV